MGTREDLIEAITLKVLAELKTGHCDGQCDECQGSCAAHCSDKVQTMVDQGVCRISYSGDGVEVPQELAAFIDHTKLGPGATAAEIERLCD